MRALVLFGLIALIGTATHGTLSFGSTPTTVTQETAGDAQPSPQFQWTTTQTFSGTGLQKTDTFTVGDHWRIVWSCDPGSVEGEDYLVLIEVDAPDGSILDRGVETLCQQHTTHGIDEMYSGGQVSLHVVCIGKWTVQVQEWQEAESSAA
jgi:hypothetical protein